MTRLPLLPPCTPHSIRIATVISSDIPRVFSAFNVSAETLGDDGASQVPLAPSLVRLLDVRVSFGGAIGPLEQPHKPCDAASNDSTSCLSRAACDVVSGCVIFAALQPGSYTLSVLVANSASTASTWSGDVAASLVFSVCNPDQRWLQCQTHRVRQENVASADRRRWRSHLRVRGRSVGE